MIGPSNAERDKSTSGTMGRGYELKDLSKPLLTQGIDAQDVLPNDSDTRTPNNPPSRRQTTKLASVAGAIPPSNRLDATFRSIKLHDDGADISEYPSNTILTSRYTVYNFIPKNLFEQFHNVANCYFLFMAILQSISIISTTGGIPTLLGPLSFIMTISAIRAALEDVARHKSDEKENSKLYLVFNRNLNEFIPGKSGDLKVGDIVKITDDQSIPADVLFLKSAQEQYIQGYLRSPLLCLGSLLLSPYQSVCNDLLNQAEYFLV